jgi:exonuclease V gamma subunit
MAGFDVHPWTRLESLISGAATRDDPWEPARLVWAILAVCERDAPGLAPLRAHLSANDQRYANALRVARLLHRYADHRPAWLAGWLEDPASAESDPGRPRVAGLAVACAA